MYESFFGLADTPFRLTPDPRYLFLSKKHAEALAHLKLGLRESSGFVCITGEVGTGKTTLLRSFLRELGPEIATAYVFNPPLTALELLKTINAELGLQATSFSRKRLVDALNAHLLAQREAGRRSIVVIDEAQTLPMDVLEQLRLLSNLETTTEKLLRIVLVGQPQLRALLLHPDLVQLNQRITLRWHMGPLARRETGAYIVHRLTVAAGGPPPKVFTRRAVRLIHRISGGVPRLINLLAHRGMLAAFAADRRVVSTRYVRQAYREIGALPLAASAPRSRPRKVVAWTATGLAAGLVIAAGVARWSGFVTLPAVSSEVVAEAPLEDVVAVEPAVAEPVEPVAADAPATEEAQPVAAEAVAAAPEVPTAVNGAPAEPVAEAPAEPVVVAATPPPAEPSAPAVDVAARLAELDGLTSAQVATDALLAAWQVRPREAADPVAPAGFVPIAQRRGLEYLPLVGNASMLRLLDLPAILELRIPGVNGPRYVALTGMQDGRPMLVVDKAATAVDAGFLDRHWFGQAHVFWRDFETLGPTFGRDWRGAAVARLQAILRGMGIYAGPVNGFFDGPTEAAVLEFQRSRLLVPDGKVGRLTRIVLYAAKGGYARPTLGAAS